MPQQQPLNPLLADALAPPSGVALPKEPTPWWFSSAHLQTCWPFLVSPHKKALAFLRQRWESPDGDFIDVDFQSRRGGGQAPERNSEHPLLILFHGLEGSSQSHYAQELAAWTLHQGWDLAIAHFRGCSGEPNRLARAYHAGDDAEIRWILQRFASDFPQKPLYTMGVSLGGNALLRALASDAITALAPRLRAAVSLCAPLDLSLCAQALETGINRWLYTPYFLRSMQSRAERFMQQHPTLLNAAAIRRARTLREFDDAFTAPLHGFQGVDDYYQQASSLAHLAGIHICPVLIVNPLNDPFVPPNALPSSKSLGPTIELWQPQHGGHVGFVHPQHSLLSLSTPWLLTLALTDLH